MFYCCKAKWTNKHRVLVFSSRGVSFQARHLMRDMRSLMPHSKSGQWSLFCLVRTNLETFCSSCDAVLQLLILYLSYRPLTCINVLVVTPVNSLSKVVGLDRMLQCYFCCVPDVINSRPAKLCIVWSIVYWIFLQSDNFHWLRKPVLKIYRCLMCKPVKIYVN